MEIFLISEISDHEDYQKHSFGFLNINDAVTYSLKAKHLKDLPLGPKCNILTGGSRFVIQNNRNMSVFTGDNDKRNATYADDLRGLD